MAAPQSTPLPEAPTRGEAEGQFVPKANAFVGALEPFRQQLQAQADFVNERSTETEENAALAQDASEMALSSANFAGDWSGLSGAFDVPTSVLHDDTYWQLLEDVSNIQDDEPGVSGSWAPINAARNVVLALPNITSLSSLNTAALVDGQQFSVGSYLPDTSTGSCLLRWRPDLPKSRHDGVLFFSLTVPMFTGTDTADYRNGVGETDSGGGGVLELVRGEIIYDATVLVPTHYSTPGSAVKDLAGRISFSPDAEAIIRIESGYVVSSGVALTGGDYSRFRFTAEDSTVNLSPSFSGDIFTFDNCRAPTVDAFFDAAGAGGIDRGIAFLNTSIGVVAPGAGVINVVAASPGGSIGNGLFLEKGSVVKAVNTIFKGCNLRNVHITTGSTLDVSASDLREGIGDFNVWVSRRSRIVLDGCQYGEAVNGGGLSLVRSEASSVPFSSSGVSCRNCATRNLVIADGSIFHGGSRSGQIFDASGAGTVCIEASEGSIVNVEDANLSNSGGRSILANTMARVNAKGANCSNAGSSLEGILATNGANIELEGADCSGATGKGAVSRRGATISGTAANFRKTESVNDEDDIVVDAGGIFQANAAQGGVSQTANTITSAGIIFK